MNEKQIKIIDTIAARWADRLAEEERARLQRAVEALKGGGMRFRRNGDEVYVANGESSYTIRRAEDRWVCSCPDFEKRASAKGWRCKHLFAYFLSERAGLVQASPNGPEPSPEASGPEQPQPPAPQPQPQAAPTFGEDKGKPLTKCHPKWVAVLGKKGLEDAFTLQDAVTYAVARRLQEARQQERRKKEKASASALDTEVFLGAIRQVILEAIREALPAALEAVREQEADREAILADLADLRRRVEALEKAARAAGALAAREAMLAAR